MNDVLREILTTGRITVGGERRVVHSSIQRAVGEFLQKLIDEHRPQVSLEVGLAHGVSALFICEALKRLGAGRHIVIDPDQFEARRGDPWNGAGMAALNAAGFGDIVKLENDVSYRVLPQLEAAGVTIDFAFMDGWHTFDYCLMDAVLIDRILKVGGVLVLHGAHRPGVHRVCRYLLTNRAYRVTASTTTPHSPELRPLVGPRRPLPDLPWRVWRDLRPELCEPDSELGLPSHAPVVAMIKTADDNRRWDFHEDF
jgi:predicted O-methyltransferase YrrM